MIDDALSLAPRKRVLVVDEDGFLRQELTRQLSLRGFQVVDAADGAAAQARLRDVHFDAVLLSLTLPDMDGRNLCRLMRDRQVRCPILLLTAADADSDAIAGLDNGANDCIAKPFRMDVLHARLRSHLREFDRSVHAIFAIGAFDFLPGARLMVDRKSARRIRLTERETTLLRLLYQQDSRVVNSDTLLEEMAAKGFRSNRHALEVAIYRLRQKIERDASDPRLLVRGEGGYRLAAEPPPADEARDRPPPPGSWRRSA